MAGKNKTKSPYFELMRQLLEQGCSRRGFWLNCLRGCALGALAAIAALTTVRGRLPRSRELCIQPGSCQGCGKFSHCNLPQAWEQRRLEGRSKIS